MDSIPISKAGYELKKTELEELKAERPAIILAIAEAREEGDLSENAGYHAARERQGWLEAKINFINSRMPIYNVIDPAEMDGDKVAFSATVEIENLDTEEVSTYTLMGPDETDFFEGAISIVSPVGRALLGKEEGDEILVDAPKGRVEYEILSVQYNNPKPKK
ncbi:MAG: transcription elongation factor GreA [Proteobacteria bacterium]|nr:transcription elongation factor GreA [Pseudomonadota bacterium]MBU1610615.1 transcription elongation factor GreA [Pseudomonadota bacterium]